MSSSAPRRFWQGGLILYLALWFVANLFFLETYPFLHGDEPWLSGLSRHMAETGRLAVTEPFYDLYPRRPHAFKIFFHICQIVFLRLFGNNLFSFRLLSLLSGTAALALFHRLFRLSSPSSPRGLPLAATVLLSLDIQFIYLSHLARQEIIMISLMLLSLNLLLNASPKTDRTSRSSVLSGLTLGLALGFHPNAFIIAWPASLLMAVGLLSGHRKAGEALSFLGTAAVTVLLLTLLSLSFNNNFFTDYLNYGRPLGVTDPLGSKALALPGFLKTVLIGPEGTYHLPKIWHHPPLFLLALATVKKGKLPALGLLGLTAGLLILGKYSPPSYGFYLPFLYLSLGNLGRLTKPVSPATGLYYPLLFLLLISLFSGGSTLKRELSPVTENYNDYLTKLEIYLPQNGIVLGHLNLEYYLDRGRLYHWRNLSGLTGDGVASYLRERKITHIVITEEIDFLYSHSPRWDMLYGPVSGWYPPLKEFLEDSCTLEGRFSSPGYGTRIAPYRHRGDWSVSVYRINPSNRE